MPANRKPARAVARLSAPLDVEVTIKRIAGLVTAVAVLVSVIWTAAAWVYRVDADVEKTPPIEQAVGILTQQSQLQQELWGENYRKRIAEVLKRETRETYQAAAEKESR